MSKFNSIILIDDDEISNFLCKETIISNEIAKEVYTFTDAYEALNFLSGTDEENSPDIIFLDINMPGMDGWDFLEDFKKVKSSIKKKITVIILSSSNYKMDIEKSKRFTDVGDFLSKPLTADILTSLMYRNSDCASTTFS